VEGESVVQVMSMASLFKKLSTVGLSEGYVRKAGLPSWWSDELNEQPTAVLEGAGHIAKRLHVELESLLKEDQGVQFKPLPQPKFKYHLQQSSDIPSVSCQLASRVTELVSLAVQHPFVPIPENVDNIREEVLRNHAKVTLESLLDYCWRQGIPVAYFNDYPANTRKITGMIQWQGNRPVILLSHNRTHPSWLAFHLAHELAHLALGHVKEGILIDDDINQASDDAEEIAANYFAVKLLVNSFDNCFGNVRIHNNGQLKSKILEKLDVDPTVDACALAFNYGWHTENYGFSNKVVKSLPCNEEGDKIINQFLENHLDWDVLSSDNTDHLECILGDES
jgi:hypothetical protein